MLNLSGSCLGKRHCVPSDKVIRLQVLAWASVTKCRAMR